MMCLCWSAREAQGMKLDKYEPNSMGEDVQASPPTREMLAGAIATGRSQPYHVAGHPDLESDLGVKVMTRSGHEESLSVAGEKEFESAGDASNEVTSPRFPQQQAPPFQTENGEEQLSLKEELANEEEEREWDTITEAHCTESSKPADDNNHSQGYPSQRNPPQTHSKRRDFIIGPQLTARPLQSRGQNLVPDKLSRPATSQRSRSQAVRKIRDGQIVAEDEGEMKDVLGDLGAVCKHMRKAKERSSTASLDEVDSLPVVQNEGSPLNIAPSKQRVELRQKGSLAKRRRPTRTSVRGNQDADNVFDPEDDTDVKSPALMNGLECPTQTGPTPESKSRSRSDCEGHQESGEAFSPEGPVLKTGKPVPGVSVLPSVEDGGKKRLRSVPSAAEYRSSQVEGSSQPAWMVEARLRKANRPPKGEVEKLQQEREPETPAWMKDALAKKKRASIILEAREAQSSNNSNKDSVENGSVSSVPWMKERMLRSSSSSGNDPSPVSLTTIDTNKDTAVPARDDDLTRNEDSAGKVKLIIMSPVQDSPESSSTTADSTEVTTVSVQRSLRTNTVESRLVEVDENTPPAELNNPYTHKEKRTEQPQKNTHGTSRSNSLESTKQTEADKENETAEMQPPAWKMEIQQRRKHKTYIHALKPDQPLRLGQTPQWKRDLAEKNKTRRESEDGPLSPLSPLTNPPQSPEAVDDVTLPLWKQEITRRRKSGSTPIVLDTVEKEKKEVIEEEEEMPEWTQLVERRRQRLASSGLIAAEQEGGVS